MTKQYEIFAVSLRKFFSWGLTYIDQYTTCIDKSKFNRKAFIECYSFWMISVPAIKLDLLHFLEWMVNINEPRRENTVLRGFQQGLTQTGL